jgi:hypothetical protein
VLACHLRDDSFASLFIVHSSAAIDILKSLAKECSPGLRLPEEESKCHRLRMLYRDCAKPPPPPIKFPTRSVSSFSQFHASFDHQISFQAKEITWDTSRSFPPVRSCLFSHGLTVVTFLGDPSAGSGLPRGTLVYASQPIPSQVCIICCVALLFSHLPLRRHHFTGNLRSALLVTPLMRVDPLFHLASCQPLKKGTGHGQIQLALACFTSGIHT